MTKYEKQRKVFKQLIKHIQSTISIDAAVLIANKSSHSYNLLRALKLHFASTNQNKKIQIKAKYHELCKGSDNQNLNKWLNVWRKIYIIDKTLNVYKIIKKQSIKDFIYSIMNKNEIWANAHLAFIDAKIKNDSLFNLIAKFRNHIRMKSNKKFHHSTHSAFSASEQSNQSNQQSKNHSNQTNQNQNQNLFFRSRGGFRDRDRKKNDFNASFQRKQQISECICGEFHYYFDCNYINFIKRSTG